MPRVFISHSSLDRDVVEREIIVPLTKSGIDIWYSKDSIQTATEWEVSIRDGLKMCDWFLVIMSPHAVASKWVRREVHWAMEKREGRIVPVMMQKCDPEDLHLGLPLLQFIDFRADIKKAQHQLLAIWGVNWRAEEAQPEDPSPLSQKKPIPTSEVNNQSPPHQIPLAEQPKAQKGVSASKSRNTGFDHRLRLLLWGAENKIEKYEFWLMFVPLMSFIYSLGFISFHIGLYITSLLSLASPTLSNEISLRTLPGTLITFGTVMLMYVLWVKLIGEWFYVPFTFLFSFIGLLAGLCIGLFLGKYRILLPSIGCIAGAFTGFLIHKANDWYFDR
jgi:TIR domain